MNKILSGAMGIVMTGAVVTSSAYALFSAQATVSGISFSTSTVALEVSANGTEFSPNLDANLDLEGAFPGYGMDNSVTAPLIVRNTSGDATLDVTAQLTAATGWNDSQLKDFVEVAVVPDDTLPEDVGDEEYMTLVEWNASPHAIIDALAPNTTAMVDVYVRLPETAPNSLQGKSLTDITFTLVGTQVEEVIEE